MQFKDAVSESSAVFIVGSGVSAHTTQGAPTATWHGLIKSGAQLAISLDKTLDGPWLIAVDSSLDAGLAVQAAGMVATKLKDFGDRVYSKWLEESVGNLNIEDSSVAESLLAYPFPILTTNYDTLLEQVGDRSSTDWTDLKPFHDSLVRESTAIAHLHGIWSNPNSVVLSEVDYERILREESIQQITRALSTLRSIIYVGFGAGLDDPNFSALRNWQKDVFPTSGLTHYRLCRESEESELKALHAGENVVPIVYGRKHDDLAEFLRENLPPQKAMPLNDVGLARDVIEDARIRLRGSMMTESVLMEAGSAEFETRDLIVPPVFLPMPHSHFVQAQMRGGGDGEVSHIDGNIEVISHDFFVVVGDEESGLTTALKWLAAESSEFIGSAAPVFVRYSDCRVNKAPFEYAVNNAAMNLGLLRDGQDTLPDHVIALDDYTFSNSPKSVKVLTGLLNNSAFVKIIGCALGEEDRLVSRLSESGITPRVLYLGRMRRADITVLAEKISPGDSERLTREVVRVLDAEGLRKNPMTVSLLLYLIHRNAPREMLNRTSLIDAYLSLLLMGIGAPQDDAFGLSETDVEAILSSLAEFMVIQETASISELSAVESIGETLDRFGWKGMGSAGDLLGFLLRKRVLRKHGTAIEFARYSYLTFFAAKRALSSDEFHSRIVGDIFYYSPVAKRLAALGRSDRALFGELGPLLREELSTESVKGLPFELLAQEVVTEAPSEQGPVGPVEGGGSGFGDELEMPESESPGSFGLVKSEMSTVSRMSRSARLASSILRDLDQIEQLDEKRELLVMVLEVWGRFITELSSDPSIKELEKAVVIGLGEEGEGEPGRQWRDFIARSIPAVTALSGIEAELVSSKLTVAFDDAFSRKELLRSAETIIAALFFLAALRPSGWVAKARALVKEADSTWVLINVYHRICEGAFAQLPSVDEGLLALCGDLFEKNRSFENSAIRSAHVDLYHRHLRTLRARTLHGGGV